MHATTGTLATMWLPTGDNLFLISPELALTGTIVALLLWPLIARRGSYSTAGLALLGVLVAAILTLRVGARVAESGWAGLSPDAGGAGMLLADNFSVFFKLLVLLFLAAIIALWLIGSARAETHSPEFFTLLLGSALGMILMVASLNLLMLLVAVELASLPSYAIVGFNKYSRRSAEASLKYVIFGAVSAAIMLYGISLLYGYYGTLDVGRIAAIYASGLTDPATGTQLIAPGATLLVHVALIGVLAGVAFKISAVPFHFWCPDVFEGASIEVTTWLSVASKAAGLGLLLRLIYTFTEAAGSALGAAGAVSILTPVAWVIGIMAAVTCTVANFAAFRQDNIKRLLAYSSIAHAGYMMTAGAILLVAGDQAGAGVSALVFYISIYLFMNLGVFGVAALVYWRTGSESLDAFNGLGRRATIPAVAMTVCLFSLIGLPPLAGFSAKWWLLWALGEAAKQQVWLWWLIIVVVLNTLISLWYYVRVMIRMFLIDDGQPAFTAAPAGQAIVTVCALVMLAGFVWMGPLKNRTDAYASNLYKPAARQVVAHADEPPAPDVAPAGVAAAP